jgi:hypothetical protein
MPSHAEKKLHRKKYAPQRGMRHAKILRLCGAAHQIYLWCEEPMPRDKENA